MCSQLISNNGGIPVKIKMPVIAIMILAALLMVFLGWDTVSAYSADSDPQGDVLYVKPDAGGACASWTDACDLQKALSDAQAGDQIWVAAGIYKPTTIDDQNAYFYLKSGITLYGGFYGTEASLSQRDWQSNPTILSGEIGDPAILTDNSRIILAVYDGSYGIVADGFSIQNGYNTDNASGLYAYNSQGTFSNLILTNNTANQGGAINFTNGKPKLVNVTILENHASWGGGLYLTNVDATLTDVTISNNSATMEGGGVYSTGGNISLTRVTISGNSAVRSGGGFYAYDTDSILTDVSFLNNTASSYEASIYYGGGGMFNFGPEGIGNQNSVTLNNVLFSGNSSADDGGGLYNLRIVSELTNVTFTGNHANRGGALSNSIVSYANLTNVTFTDNSITPANPQYGGAIFNFSTSTVTITNTILWGNSVPQLTNSSATATISYSDVQGGCSSIPGTTCSNSIDANPLLNALANNGGFTQTQALSANSPAIDTGDSLNCPSKDQRGYYRPINGDSIPGARCDMGAYEYDSFLLTGPILYADSAAQGHCTAWSDTCDLQTALDHAEPGWEIWVKHGIHKPTFVVDIADPRTATFLMKPGVAIYGGFLGNETDFSERDWQANLTTLSGEIGSTGISDNTYHVVSSNGLDDTAVLDGFTITLGNANGTSDSDKQGGGMRNYQSSPTISHVTFLRNEALLGGGMYNFQSAPGFNQVTFYKNRVLGTDSCGGGLVNDASSPTLTEAIFEQNTAAGNGAGICNRNASNPSINQVLFIGNDAEYFGGGIASYNYSNPNLSNVTFTANRARNLFGGAIFNDTHSIATITNATIYQNIATSGAGIYNNQSSQSIVRNSILWANQPENISNDTPNSSATVSYSDIDQDSFAGSNGNIRVDPKLLALDDNGGFSRTLALRSDSLAIDTADPSVCVLVDERGYARPIDGNSNGIALCDMGAFEYGSLATSFALNITKVGNGTVSISPEKSKYLWGDIVTLTPTPGTNYGFAGWSGDVTSAENPLTVTIHGDTNITANFIQTDFTLTVQVDPVGSGTVSRTPDYLTYQNGDEVTLTPTTNPGWTFSHWTGAVVTDNKLTITGDTTVTAHFSPIEYTLTVQVDPADSGTVSRSPDSATYHYGDVITLTPNVNPGWIFSHWTGPVASDNTLTIMGDTLVTANFMQIDYQIYLPLTMK